MNRVLALLVGAVVLLAILAGVVVGRRTTPDLDPHTPDHTAVNGDHAVVTVDVTEGSGDDPFGSSGYSHSERITVQRDGGVWKITGSPWLLPACGSTKG